MKKVVPKFLELFSHESILLVLLFLVFYFFFNQKYFSLLATLRKRDRSIGKNVYDTILAHQKKIKKLRAYQVDLFEKTSKVCIN